MTDSTAGIVALDTRRAFGGGRREGGGHARARDSRVHRMLNRAEEAATLNAILLRECDHRIKNSLQIVASLLHMKARRAETPDVAMALKGAAAQIRAISHIHDVLQQSGERQIVDLGDVLIDLCESLQAMTGDARAITIEGAAEAIETPIWFTQPVVLAITELITNALRHAFDEGRDAAVHVSLAHHDGQFRIVVSDNGRGLPPGYAEGKGYGMTLVRAMVQQIGGTLLAETDGGARFTITAPLVIA